MNSKLESFASIAEIIAAIGVILSLIFVGMQLDEGNKETRAATVQASSDTSVALMSELLLYADVWEKVLAGETLSDEIDARRGIILFNLVMTENENFYFQLRSGYVDNSAWEGRIENMSLLLALPIYSVWRQSVGGIAHDTEFLALLDERVAFLSKK